MRYSVDIISSAFGVDLEIHTLRMNSGFQCKFLNIGATILEIQTPDRQGKLENVVLAYPNLETYYTNPEYMGCTVGPTAGRIWRGNLAEGLSLNKGENHIHGGFKGLSTTAFVSHFYETENGAVLIFKTTLPDGLDGYPGNRQFEVIYKVYEDFKVTICYRVVSDQDTWVNLTNHAYFNLSGEVLSPIEGHELFVDSDWLAETDEASIPTGRLLPVEGTAFDFKQPKTIGSQIDEAHPQLLIGRGYDHPFLLNPNKTEPQLVLRDPVSGRKLSVTTDQQAAVIYTNNYEVPPYGTRKGVCIECQQLPIGWERCFETDSKLKANAVYSRQIDLQFSIA